MPNGWDVYYIVFLSAGLALSIPLCLGVLSLFIAPRGREKIKSQPEPTAAIAPLTESPTTLGRKMNPRFFLGLNAAFLLIVLALALVPCVGVLQKGTSRGDWLRGLINIIVIALCMGLGLFYAARKGDLSWLRSFKPEKIPPKSSSPQDVSPKDVSKDDRP